MFVPPGLLQWVRGMGTEAKARACNGRGRGFWTPWGGEEGTPEGEAGRWELALAAGDLLLPRFRLSDKSFPGGDSFPREALGWRLSQGQGAQLQGDRGAPRRGLPPTPEIACSSPGAGVSLGG